MKKVVALSLATFICSMVYTQNVSAFGLGLTSSVTSGTAKHTYEGNSQVSGSTDFNYETDRNSVGVVMDTNLSKDKVFNYRLGVMYEKEKLSRSGFNYEVKGVSFDNDFGFGVVRNENLRLWLGPELRLSYLEKEWNSNTKTALVEIGVGPVVGVNFNLGSVVTLSAKAGYIFNGTAGNRTNTSASGGDTTISGTGNYPLLNFALLFRMGEQ